MRLKALNDRLISITQGEYFGVSQRTSLDFSLILLANIVNSGTTFVANVIVARIYGHEIFGLFSIATNIALTTLIFSEFGMNLTMVRLYKLHEEDLQKSKAVLLWNFYFKSIILATLILIAVLFGETLSNMLVRNPNKSILMAMALIGGGLLGFWSYLKVFLQSFNMFKNIAYMTFIYAFLKVAFLTIFIGFFPSPNVELLFLGIYILPGFLTLFMGLYKYRDKLNFAEVKKKELKEVGKEIINYSKWVAISGISFVLIQKGMVFIVAYYTCITQVSLLSAGLLFTGIFTLINESVRQILLPKIAQLDSKRIKEYKNKILKIFPFYFLLSLILIGILSVFMYFSLGEEYKESLPLFWIASISIALTAGVGFYTILFHSIMKPVPDTFANIGTLICSLLVNLLVVEKYGAVGVVISYAIILFCGEIIKAFLLSRYLKKVFNE